MPTVQDDRDFGAAAAGAAVLAFALGRLNSENRAVWNGAALGFATLAAFKFSAAGIGTLGDTLVGLPGRLLDRLRGSPPHEHSEPAAGGGTTFRAAPNPQAGWTGPAIVGRFLDPVDGGEVDIGPLTSTYPVLLELENSGAEVLEGSVELDITEAPLFSAGATWTQIGGQRFTLLPGSRRLVTVNVQARSSFSAFVTVTARLRFAGHYVTTATWELS